MSDPVRPHRWQPTRLPRPWDSPVKNTGVGCHFLLQYMKVKSESEVAESCPTLSDPMDCSLPGSSVHGIFQARVLEWGAIAFSRYTYICIYIAITLKQNWDHTVYIYLIDFLFLLISSFNVLSWPCHMIRIWNIIFNYEIIKHTKSMQTHTVKLHRPIHPPASEINITDY